MNHVKGSTMQLVCKRIVLILTHERNLNAYGKHLQNFAFCLQTNAILFICLSHGFLALEGEFLLVRVVAVFEPIPPSLNHITKLAQTRKKNVMQAFGWESWDEDKALPGSLIAPFLFKGKICFYQLWRSGSKIQRLSSFTLILDPVSKIPIQGLDRVVFTDLSTGAQETRLCGWFRPVWNSALFFPSQLPYTSYFCMALIFCSVPNKHLIPPHCFLF